MFHFSWLQFIEVDVNVESSVLENWNGWMQSPTAPPKSADIVLKFVLGILQNLIGASFYSVPIWHVKWHTQQVQQVNICKQNRLKPIFSVLCKTYI